VHNTVGLVSVDPGLRSCGVAYWKEGVLQAAQLVLGDKKARDAAAWRAMTDNLHHEVLDFTGSPVAIEFPQVYRYGKGDPNDLLQLAVIVGGCFSWTDNLHVYRPREWKRQVPKNIMCQRIQDRLTEEERRRVALPVPSLAHNVWDAVGIGLHHLGRL
jgi:hypothetical protein